MSSSPFSSSPNPNSLHLTATMKATVFRSKVAIDHRQGLACILGDVGVGKSSLLRYLWAEYDSRPDTTTQFIHTPDFKSPFIMARKICAAFALDLKRSLGDQQSVMERFLLAEHAAGRNVILFVDESQLLIPPCLELVRTMLNFETNTAKLIQIVIAGQLDLRDRLLTKKAKPIKSRVFTSSILLPLEYGDMAAMLRVRCERESISWPFTESALRSVYEMSAGVPRQILQTCEMAYTMMQAAGAAEIDEPIIRACGGALVEAA